MKTILLSIIFSFYFFANAQLNLHNIKYFNGYYLSCQDLISLPDGGLMWIGGIDGNGPFNFPTPPHVDGYGILMMRFDKDLNILWNKRIQGGVMSAIASKDGGFLLTGQTTSDTGIFAGHPLPPLPANKNIYVMKVDSVGNMLWVNTISGLYTANYNVYTIAETIDKGAFIAGITDTSGGDFGSHYGPMYSYDWFLAKFDNTGNKLWVKIKGGSYSDMQCKMISDENGGIYFTSFTGSSDYDLVNNIIPFNIGPHGYVGHWDSSGNTIWGRTCGGTGWNVLNEVYYDKQSESVIVGGHTSSTDFDLQGHFNASGSYDYWVMRFDTSGNLKWSNAWGGDEEEEVRSISKNNNTNNYLIGGYSYSKNGDLDSIHTQMNYDADAWLIALDSIGVLTRKRQIGGNKGDAISIVLNSPTKLFVCGSTESVDDDFSTHTPQFTDGSIFIAELLDYPDMISDEDINNKIEVYPIPVSNNLFIKADGIYDYQLLDTRGRSFIQGKMDRHVNIDITLLSTGMYVLNLRNNVTNITTKIIKQ